MKPDFFKASDLIDPKTETVFSLQAESNTMLQSHFHDFFEIALVTEGVLILVVNEVEYRLKEGALVLIRPGEIHTKKATAICNHINLGFPEHIFDTLFEYLGESGLQRSLLDLKNLPVIHLSKGETHIIKGKLENIYLVSYSDSLRMKLELRLLILELITKCFMKSSEKKRSKLPEWLEYTVAEMQRKENFVSGLPALIQMSGKTHAYLCRSFKKYLNLQPTELINELRLNYAANLLIHTDLSITIIALESGFGNLSHFHHLFVRKFGISPNNYRKRNGCEFLF